MRHFCGFFWRQVVQVLVDRITGVHQIPSGRLYQYDKTTKRMEPASGWIKV